MSRVPDFAVVRFDQNRSRRGVIFDTIPPAGPIVTIAKTGHPKSDKHREYARFAAHCLSQENAASDADSRDIQRQMALEWLKLAHAALHPFQPTR